MRSYVISTLMFFTFTASAAQGDLQEYTVSTMKSRFGDTIYALSCNNGSTICKYNWETLCESGKAKNTTPLGGVSDDAPSYIRVDGRPARIYICE